MISIVYPEPILTGFDESALAAETFKIYPNPTRDKLTIEKLANVRNELAVELVNMQGGTVLATFLNVNELSKNISISNFPKGLYMVRVQGKGQVKLTKLAIVDSQLLLFWSKELYLVQLFQPEFYLINKT